MGQEYCAKVSWIKLPVFNLNIANTYEKDYFF